MRKDLTTYGQKLETGKCRCPKCSFVFLPHIAKAMSASKKELIGVDSQEISSLIKMFEPVNPSVYQLFKNTTQRVAIARLIKKHGLEKIKMIIKYLPEMNSQPYAPVVTTPYMLEAKLGQILAFTAKKAKEVLDNDKRGVDARDI